MDPDALLVAWCAPSAIRFAPEKAPPGIQVVWTSPADPFGNLEIAILDTRAFDRVSDLIRARLERPARPVLILCSRDEAEEIVTQLHYAEEVDLHDSPHALIAFRVRRLLARGEELDILTGLSQRSVFIKSMQQALEDPARLPVSLLLVDLDDFKKLNDMLGHAAGDEALQDAATRIRRVAPPTAVVGRLGGDEFAVCDTLRPADAAALAERIRGAFQAAPFQRAELTASIGCATASLTGQHLFGPADEALYAAKAKGRDCVVHYDDMARRAREQDQDVAFEGFENRTRVLAERVAEWITRRGRKLFEELKEQADVDAVTGLFSRRYLDRRLPFEAEVSAERSTPLTVALLDIDFFGQVNKQYGWPSGDKVLVEVAERIRSSTRTGDWVARFGGEEICVVMYATPLEAARPVLERIRSAVARAPFTTTEGREIEVTVSGGAAERAPQESLEALMERVSQKLLLAKQSGRNRVEA